MRTQSLSARLRACGLPRPQSAADWLQGEAWQPLLACPDFWADLAAVADPEQSLLGLVNLVERSGRSDLPAVLAARPEVRRGLLAAFGLSRFWADYVAAHPYLLEELSEPLLGEEGLKNTSGGATEDKNASSSSWPPAFWDGENYDEQAESRVAGEYERQVRGRLLAALNAYEVRPGAWVSSASPDTLRRAYRSELARILVLDAVHPDPLAAVSLLSRLLSALTDATLEAALALARAQHDPQAEVDIAVLALGKTGAQELNYLSDIDVIFVAEPHAQVCAANASPAAPADLEPNSSPDSSPSGPGENTGDSQGRNTAPRLSYLPARQALNRTRKRELSLTLTQLERARRLAPPGASRNDSSPLPPAPMPARSPQLAPESEDKKQTCPAPVPAANVNAENLLSRPCPREETECLRRAEQLIVSLINVLNGPGAELPLWEIDLALRPEGKDGPLVRTLASHLDYYRRWAKNWEFQALLKARPAAGARELGERYLKALAPLIWNASSRADFVEETRALRKRVEAHIPRAEVDREIKLVPGGLRDIEFSVQLLQLVHGKVDTHLRVAPTLEALARLARNGYISRADGVRLARAYRFMRVVEHRVQMQSMKRTHLFPAPTQTSELKRVARSLYQPPPWYAACPADPSGEETSRGFFPPASSPEQTDSLACKSPAPATGLTRSPARSISTRVYPAFSGSSRAVPLASRSVRETSGRAASKLPALPAVAKQLLSDWKLVRPQVRELQQEIFYRPLLALSAKLSAPEAGLDALGAQARLQALGFADPRGALAHISALTSGVSRRARIARHLLPVLLNWFAASPAPDAGLLRFRRLSEQIGSSHWYMRLLRDSRVAAERLCRVLSLSPFIAQGLESWPEAVQWLADDDLLRPPTREQLRAELSSLAIRYCQVEELAERVLAVRHRELLRVAMNDVVSHLQIEPTQRAISLLNDETLRVLATAVREHLLAGSQLSPQTFPHLALVALGRGGGAESGYASDGDLMVLFADPEMGLAQAAIARADQEGPASKPPAHLAGESEASKQAIAFASTLRDILCAGGSSPAFTVDYDLRPEGRQGPLARSLEYCADYYARWASTWERQALLRARVVWDTGGIGDKFETLIASYRYPGCLEPGELKEIRRLKARMEKERVPGGRDSNQHVKLGPGGLSDVEWSVQLLQLRHAAQQGDLRTSNTLAALAAAQNSGLLNEGDANALRAAWILASRIRNGNALVSGRLSGHRLDYLPSASAELKCLGALLGYAEGSDLNLAEDYLRAARRARAVTMRLFYER